MCGSILCVCIQIDSQDAKLFPWVFCESDDCFDTPTKRYSKDQSRPNNYGYRLLDICKNNYLYIYNGRIGRDSGIGMYTSSGRTVVDYIIGSPQLMSKVYNRCHVIRCSQSCGVNFKY